MAYGAVEASLLNAGGYSTAWWRSEIRSAHLDRALWRCDAPPGPVCRDNPTGRRDNHVLDLTPRSLVSGIGAGPDMASYPCRKRLQRLARSVRGCRITRVVVAWA